MLSWSCWFHGPPQGVGRGGGGRRIRINFRVRCSVSMWNEAVERGGWGKRREGLPFRYVKCHVCVLRGGVFVLRGRFSDSPEEGYWIRIAFLTSFVQCVELQQRDRRDGYHVDKFSVSLMEFESEKNGRLRSGRAGLSFLDQACVLLHMKSLSLPGGSMWDTGTRD